MKYIITTTILLAINIIVLHISPIFGYNIQNTPILVSTKKVNLDGELGIDEWSDATKINFSSPTTSKSYILIYLKYNPFEKALEGAFVIPDKTSDMSSNGTDQPDQIGFLFDMEHSKSNKTQSTDQQIVFTRGQRVEYYIGDNISNDYKSIRNVTSPSNAMPLNKPLSNVSFSIIPNTSNNTIWQGEFKIYFNEDPKVYGFAISQVDAFVNDNADLNYAFINYPGQNYTQAQIPSTWGDIIFPQITSYYQNIHNVCGNSNGIISQIKPIILCGKANPLSIDDKSKSDIVVYGFLGNILNGSRITDGKIIINVTDSQGNLINGPFTMNDNDHIFSYSIPSNNWKNGAYKIWLKSPSNKLEMNFDLNVFQHIPNIDELFAQMGLYIALAGGLIGVAAIIPKIKSYFISNQQRIKTTEKLIKINKIYDETRTQNKENGLKYLKEERDEILWMFKRENITEGQFVIINQKISDYMDKLQKD